MQTRTARGALERELSLRYETSRDKRLVQQTAGTTGTGTGAASRLQAARIDARAARRRRRRQQQQHAGRGRRRQQWADPCGKGAQRFARVKGALQRAAIGARDAEQRLCVRISNGDCCREKRREK